MLLSEHMCLLTFLILAAAFAVLMILAGFICQYKNKCSIKTTTYECGVKPTNDARINFDIKYFNYAIAFLIFDIETIFLYPFAVFINQLGWFAIIEAFIFVGLLLFGLFFAITKNMLRWM